MKSTVLLCAVLTVTSAPALAQPQTTTVKKHLIIGDESVGAISGNAGSNSAFLRAPEGNSDPSRGLLPSNRYRISSLGFSEQSDRPCNVIMRDAVVNKGNENQWFTCKGPPPGDWEWVGNEDGFWFSGVQVCLNKTQDRVKGVRLFTSKFDQDSGVLERKNKVVSFKRANCDDKDGWADDQKCPVGSILTGLKIFYRTGQGVGDTSDVMTGLAPVCRPANIRTTTLKQGDPDYKSAGQIAAEQMAEEQKKAGK